MLEQGQPLPLEFTRPEISQVLSITSTGVIS
jgi:hypothetical protein